MSFILKNKIPLLVKLSFSLTAELSLGGAPPSPITVSVKGKELRCSQEALGFSTLNNERRKRDVWKHRDGTEPKSEIKKGIGDVLLGDNFCCRVALKKK